MVPNLDIYILVDFIVRMFISDTKEAVIGFYKLIREFLNTVLTDAAKLRINTFLA